MILSGNTYEFFFKKADNKSLKPTVPAATRRRVPRLSSIVPPSASLRGECGAERWCLVLPSAALRGEQGTGVDALRAPLSAALGGMTSGARTH